ncbi:MAG TPA: copper homeostasis protein CutC [Candidatus Limnocylindrales bacterium]|nr:copper homeostasis protein CutC [Candidatus Limnocylindrales bacterium]
MATQLLLEITVESLDAALAAERGGADRIELCSELAVGGVTPNVAAMRKVHEEIEISVFPIIRPRAGNYFYTDREFATMRRDISVARDLGVDGIVLGILRDDRSVDVERTKELVDWARPLEVTFHRAFDDTADLFRALEDIIETGATRILTAGGAVGAPEGSATLQKLVAAAAARIIIMPGGGLTAANIARIAAETQAAEFHSGLGSVLPYGSSNLQKFEAEIRSMKRHMQSRALSA